MSQTFDYLDWSSGLKIQQTRVKGRPKADCESLETSSMLRWFAEQQYGKCDYGKSHGKNLPWEARTRPTARSRRRTCTATATAGTSR